MGSIRLVKGNDKGVALFLVLASVAVLTLIIGEFVYISQMNQTLAYDNADAVKAHYLAKSGLKISLLRLKAFQQIKKMLGGGSSPIPGVSHALIDKVWSFPFFFPFPVDLPGMPVGAKDAITKFQKESSLDGSFTTNIESESSKYNLNMLLAPFAPKPSPSPGASGLPGPGASGTPPPPPPGGTTTTQFNPEDARQSLSDIISPIIQDKMQNDPDFAEEYRDLRLEDLFDHLFAWVDKTYQMKTGTKDNFTPKQAPFYVLSELRMIPPIDDHLYDLLAPSLTVSTTPGINVNTMKDVMLKALVRNITDDEVKDFFKFRDDPEADNSFKSDDDFFKYLQSNIGYFAHTSGALDQFKSALVKRNIRIVVDESEFKITVKSKVNSSTRLIEAWVTLYDAKSSPGGTPGTSPSPAPSAPPANAGPGQQIQHPDAGIKITFMRIL